MSNVKTIYNLGALEGLNAIKEDITTGAEALAALLDTSLPNNECCLEKLDVSWNMIRLTSGVALTSAIAGNKYLYHLDLAYNALGKLSLYVSILLCPYCRILVHHCFICCDLWNIT